MPTIVPVSTGKDKSLVFDINLKRDLEKDCYERTLSPFKESQNAPPNSAISSPSLPYQSATSQFGLLSGVSTLPHFKSDQKTFFIAHIDTGQALVYCEDLYESLMPFHLPLQFIPPEARLQGARVRIKVEFDEKETLKAQKIVDEDIPRLLDELEWEMEHQDQLPHGFHIEILSIGKTLSNEKQVPFITIQFSSYSSFGFKWTSFISTDVWVSGEKLRLGLGADGTLIPKCRIGPEETEITLKNPLTKKLGRIEWVNVYLVLRTSRGQAKSKTLKCPLIIDGLIGYGIVYKDESQTEEAKRLVNVLGGVWIDNVQNVTVPYFLIEKDSNTDTPDMQCLGIQDIQWLRALEQGLKEQ